MFETQKISIVREIHAETLQKQAVKLFVKRDDLLDPLISGNKYRKLKYNLLNARSSGYDTLLTFGGAYSNHIHAVAAAGNKFGFKTIGIVRGESVKPVNSTIKDARQLGMQLKFISREAYRQKGDKQFLSMLDKEFGPFYCIPEGGANLPAIQGCEEIVNELNNAQYQYICCACGTGCTLAGLICGLQGDHHVLGFPVVKGGTYLTRDIKKWIKARSGKQFSNWQLISDYHFGGFVRWNLDLVHFINAFRAEHRIMLDPLYTGKMFYGIFDLIEKGFFERGSKILAVHTGGLQGIRGFNQRFGHLIDSN